MLLLAFAGFCWFWFFLSQVFTWMRFKFPDKKEEIDSVVISEDSSAFPVSASDGDTEARSEDVDGDAENEEGQGQAEEDKEPAAFCRMPEWEQLRQFLKQKQEVCLCLFLCFFLSWAFFLSFSSLSFFFACLLACLLNKYTCACLVTKSKKKKHSTANFNANANAKMFLFLCCVSCLCVQHPNPLSFRQFAGVPFDVAERSVSEWRKTVLRHHNLKLKSRNTNNTSPNSNDDNSSNNNNNNNNSNSSSSSNKPETNNNNNNNNETKTGDRSNNNASGPQTNNKQGTNTRRGSAKAGAEAKSSKKPRVKSASRTKQLPTPAACLEAMYVAHNRLAFDMCICDSHLAFVIRI